MRANPIKAKHATVKLPLTYLEKLAELAEQNDVSRHSLLRKAVIYAVDSKFLVAEKSA